MMRLIDADALFDELFRAWGDTIDAGPANAFMEMVNNAPTIAPPPNAPLTLEELRGLNGDPIWAVDLPSGKGRWEICTSRLYDPEAYGKTWLAYRRRPEEGQKL